MSAATTPVTLSKPRPGGARFAQRWAMARIVAGQLWPVALLTLLLAGRTAAVLAYHYTDWADAISLRDHAGNHAYHFGRYPDDAHTQTARLLDDGVASPSNQPCTQPH